LEFFLSKTKIATQPKIKVKELFDVYHESPQVLLIKNGECHYEESHLGIDMFELGDQIASLN